jgi:Arc/MetJ-type ribon-helix-helix transcriptional regulator
MAALKVTLPPELDRFVQTQIAASEYPDAEALVHEAILWLMPSADADAFRIARLDALLQPALDSLDRGKGIVVDDVEAFFDEIQAEIEAEFADRAA